MLISFQILYLPHEMCTQCSMAHRVRVHLLYFILDSTYFQFLRECDNHNFDYSIFPSASSSPAPCHSWKFVSFHTLSRPQISHRRKHMLLSVILWLKPLRAAPFGPKSDIVIWPYFWKYCDKSVFIVIEKEDGFIQNDDQCNFCRIKEPMKPVARYSCWTFWLQVEDSCEITQKFRAQAYVTCVATWEKNNLKLEFQQ